jgi:hypothetical protein
MSNTVNVKGGKPVTSTVLQSKNTAEILLFFVDVIEINKMISQLFNIEKCVQYASYGFPPVTMPDILMFLVKCYHRWFLIECL